MNECTARATILLCALAAMTPSAAIADELPAASESPEETPPEPAAPPEDVAAPSAAPAQPAAQDVPPPVAEAPAAVGADAPAPLLPAAGAWHNAPRFQRLKSLVGVTTLTAALAVLPFLAVGQVGWLVALGVGAFTVLTLPTPATQPDRNFRSIPVVYGLVAAVALSSAMLALAPLTYLFTRVVAAWAAPMPDDGELSVTRRGRAVRFLAIDVGVHLAIGVLSAVGGLVLATVAAGAVTAIGLSLPQNLLLYLALPIYQPSYGFGPPNWSALLTLSVIPPLAVVFALGLLSAGVVAAQLLTPLLTLMRLEHEENVRRAETELDEVPNEDE